MEENLITPNTITLRDYLRIIFRHKAVIITTFITVMVTVVIGLMLMTPVYEAQVKMLISAQKQVESPYYRELMLSGLQGSLLVDTQSEIVKSNPVIGLAVRALGLYQRPLDYEKNFSSALKKPLIAFFTKMLNNKLKTYTPDQKKEILYRFTMDDLRKHINVEAVKNTNLFTISVQDFSPVGAAILANALSRAYVIFDLQQQLAELQLKYGEKHPTAIQLKDSIDKMAKNLSGEPLPDIEAIGPASVKIMEQAVPPQESEGLSKLVTLFLAFFMSIFLGVMLAFAFEYLDQTFKSREDIERFLNLPFLGSIYGKAKAECYRNLTEQIYLLMKDKKIRSILFTAALPQEGVTTAIHNFGVNLLGSIGNKVLIIDANLREPAIHTKLNLPQGPGLTDVLEGKVTFEKAIQKAANHISVLTAGKTNLNPITLLGSSMMADVIKQAKERFEAVLIDCSELRNFNDSVILASLVDGVVLIVNEGRSRRPVVKDLLLPLEQQRANIIGAVLTNRKFTIPAAIYKRV